jgi:hypothetical protein
MPTYAEITARLDALTRRNLMGATLLDFWPVERNMTESAYIVLWHRAGAEDEEWGTHRAMLSERSDEALLTWGHYYFEESAARADFAARKR